MTATPFTFVKDIVQDKQYTFTAETSKQYLPFIVNRALSMRPNLLPYAEIANSMAHLPLQMQHDFLFFSIPKQQNRFSKWPKKLLEDELLDIIQQLWHVGPVKSMEILRLLSEDDKSELRLINESLDSKP